MTSRPLRSVAGRQPNRSRSRSNRADVRGIRVSNVFRLGLFGALGAGLGWAIWTSAGTLASILAYIGIAYFLALAFEPLIELLGRWRVKRAPAVVIAFVLLLIVVSAVVFAFVPLVVRQFSGLPAAIEAGVRSLTAAPWFQDLSTQLGIGDSLQNVSSTVITFLKNPSHLASIGGGLLSVGTGLIHGLTAVLVVVILTVYFVAGLPKITATAFEVLPASKAGTFRPIYDEMTASVGRYVAGQVLLATLNAALVLILLLIVHMPGVALLTAIAFVGALIPIAGTIVAAVITISVSLFVSPVAVIVMAIFYVVYHPLEAYIITPRVMSRAVHVPGVLVVIAVMAGTALGGVIGALVAVPVAAAGVILVNRVLIPWQRLR